MGDIKPLKRVGNCQAKIRVSVGSLGRINVQVQGVVRVECSLR